MSILEQDKRFNSIHSESQKVKLDPWSKEFAEYLDSIDPLKEYRNLFEFPINENSEPLLYMNGNSLGLMPKSANDAINNQMTKWRTRANRGHFEEPFPWLKCDEYLTDNMAKIIGAKSTEVALMNQLTVNLHLMLISFYKPTKNRYKILFEKGAFPSDHYAFESQVELHGYKCEEALIGLSPRSNEKTWHTDDILDCIEKYGNEIALICFSGVHYYTGQCYEMEKITKAGRNKGCIVGWDLAHAVGNVLIEAHNWNFDFAVWCSYKYLNSGPGGLGGIFVHEKYLNNDKISPEIYLKGWWGHKLSSRMKMNNIFEQEVGALRFRLSNTSFTAGILLKVSLEIFNKVEMVKLREKSIQLTLYLEFLLTKMVNKNIVTIITPKNINERGAQLSIEFNKEFDRDVEEILYENGILADFRRPGVIRVAPVPLYNSYKDVFTLVEILTKIYDDKN